MTAAHAFLLSAFYCVVGDALSVQQAMAAAIDSLPPAQPPNASSEAYATMWFGDPSGRAFDGLKAMIHSVRAHDVQRTFLILTLAVDLSAARAAAAPVLGDGRANPLRQLAQSFGRVFLQPTPWYTIFKNLSVVCNPKSFTVTKGRACGGGGRYLYSYSKFALWGLTQFTRIFYIDADALVLHPLDAMWTNLKLTGPLVLGASYTIKANTQLEGSRYKEPRCGYGWKQYNAGVILVRPADVIMYTVVRALKIAERSPKNPCRSDQSNLNGLFRDHVHCMPHTFNCRDPVLQTRPNPADYIVRQSRCMEEPWGNRVLDTPSLMHFACGHMPSGKLRANATVYDRAWIRHLHLANACMAASQHSAAERSTDVVLPDYDPWRMRKPMRRARTRGGLEKKKITKTKQKVASD